MSAIERVRAVVDRIDSEGHLDNAELTSDVAAISRLAPSFVALWGAAEKWAKALEQTATCRDEFGWNEVGVQACAEWQDAEDTAALAVVRALAALNEAAAREVGA